MVVKLWDIMERLRKIAPLELAQQWDNVGLLAGDHEQQVSKAMFCIDMTGAVCDEARAKGIDMIITYHPPVWEALKRVVKGQEPSPNLYDMVRNGIAIYAMHTALDSARGGINDLLADVVGITDARPLVINKVLVDAQNNKKYKLVVFVPVEDVERVSEAMFAAGAGKAYDQSGYSKCSFRVQGMGTFLCGLDSNPAVGKPGSFERVQEYRLESIVAGDKLQAVIYAMRMAHSYEEVAYDIIPLYDADETDARTGLGRYGNLVQSITVKDMLIKIKKALQLKALAVIGPGRRRASMKLKRAAVCAGSCGSILQEVISKGCDFYLTGELKHHDALKLQEAGVTTVCTGHSFSERIILHKLARQLTTECEGVDFFVSRKDADPIEWRSSIYTHRI